jgi:hypothetical protein
MNKKLVWCVILLMQISIYSMNKQSIENERQESSKGKFVLQDSLCYQKHLQEARFFSTFWNLCFSVIGFIQIVLGGYLLYFYCSGKNVRELQFKEVFQGIAGVGLGAVYGGYPLCVMRNKRKYVEKITKICRPLEKIEFRNEPYAKDFSLFFDLNFERIMYFLSEKESNITEKTFKKVDNLLNFIVMLKKDIREVCNKLEEVDDSLKQLIMLEKNSQKEFYLPEMNNSKNDLENDLALEDLYRDILLCYVLTESDELAEEIKKNYSENNTEIAKCEPGIKNINQIKCSNLFIPRICIEHMSDEGENVILYNAFPKLYEQGDQKAIEKLLDAFILKKAELKEKITQWDTTYTGYKEKNKKEILQEIRTFYEKSDG